MTELLAAEERLKPLRRWLLASDQAFCSQLLGMSEDEEAQPEVTRSETYDTRVFVDTAREGINSYDML